MTHASDRILPLSTDKDMPLRDRGRLATGFHLSQIRHLGSVIGALLARIGALPYDSRERLTTKEEQFAAFSITWATDPAHDAELAQELAGARRRRQADVAAAAPVHQAVPTPSVGDGFRMGLRATLSTDQARFHQVPAGTPEPAAAE